MGFLSVLDVPLKIFESLKHVELEPFVSFGSFVGPEAFADFSKANGAKRISALRGDFSAATVSALGLGQVLD